MQKDISELNSEKYYDDTLNPRDIIYLSMLQTFHILKKSFEIQTNLISQDIVCQQIFSKSLANDRQGLPPYISTTEYCLIIRLRHGGS